MLNGTLQHGIAKDDLAGWLNQMAPDLVLTSAPLELSHMLLDGKFCQLGEPQLALTGLPRHDMRWQAVQQGPGKNTIVLSPTWRGWLRGRPRFVESEFCQQWMAFMQSPQLKQMADAHGLKLLFIPHPALREQLPRMAVPAYIEVAAITDPYTTLLANAALVVTDFSSVGIEAALLQKPVVYFQFDEDQFYSGKHPSLSSEYQYRPHGFGPVATTRADALAAVGQQLTAPAPVYAKRAKVLLPELEGQACARAYAAIKASLGEYKPSGQSLKQLGATAFDGLKPPPVQPVSATGALRRYIRSALRLA